VSLIASVYFSPLPYCPLPLRPGTYPAIRSLAQSPTKSGKRTRVAFPGIDGCLAQYVRPWLVLFGWTERTKKGDRGTFRPLRSHAAV
jgi:hypothetical protein